MSKNISTYLRFRPPIKGVEAGSVGASASDGDTVQRQGEWIIADDNTTVQLNLLADNFSTSTSARQHRYTSVFSDCAGNKEVFEKAVQPLILEAMEGKHACVLCYGQTGSGKTHTVFGSEHDSGIVPQAIDEIYRIANSRRRDTRFKLGLSYYEVYNEAIGDLLEPARANNELTVREAPLSGTVFIDGLTCRICHTAETARKLVELGNLNKTVGNSYVHNKSSRSHTVLCLSYAAEMNVRHSATTVVSRITFVDLAGSELLSNQFSTVQQSETKAINLSLLSLRGVITALANKESHIPYRNSILTRVLSQNLSKHSITTVICNCHQDAEHRHLTSGTLNFGDVAHSVEQRAVMNEFIRSGKEIKLKAAPVETVIKLSDAPENMKAQTGASEVPVITEYVSISTRQGPIETLVVRSRGGHAGRLCLCLHAYGNGCGGRDWDFIFDILVQEGGYVIYCPEMPGFGRTIGSRQASRTDMLWSNGGPMEIVVDVMETLISNESCEKKSDSKVLLCGYDWGGNMALSLALSPYKKRMNGIVLFHPSFTDSIDKLSPITQPVLLLWIPSDQLHLYSNGKRMARTIKRSKLVSVVPPAGKERNVSWERVQNIMATHIAEWLKQQRLLVPNLVPLTRVSAETSGTKTKQSQLDAIATGIVSQVEIQPEISSSVDTDSGGSDFDAEQDELSSLSHQSSFLACLIADPIVGEELLAQRREDQRKARIDGKRQKQQAMKAEVDALMPVHANATQLAVHEMRTMLMQSPQHRDAFRDGLLRRSGGLHRTVLLGRFGAMPMLPPYASLETILSTGVWPQGGPQGLNSLRDFPRFSPGRRVQVLAPNINRCFTDAARFGFAGHPRDMDRGATFLTYRAVIAYDQHIDTRSPTCRVLIMKRNLSVSELNAALLHNTASDDVVVSNVSVTDLLFWNDPTGFPTPIKPTRVLMEDAIEARYEDLVMRCKIVECAISLSDLAPLMNFEAAVMERREATTPLTSMSAPANRRLLELQLKCLDRLRQCMNTIHHVAMGKDPHRLCVPDCGRLATYGQWHCHGMACVFASLLMPFSSVLGIHVRYRDGWVYHPTGRDIGDPTPRSAADHTWLEVTLFPSGVSLTCDPSFFGSEGTTVPYEQSYSPWGGCCRYPSRNYTHATAQQQLVENLAVPTHGKILCTAVMPMVQD